MRTGNPENASEMKNRLTWVTKVQNPKDIRAYSVELYMDAFEAVVTSFEERFQIHPVILAMEEYITSTDPTQCNNSIDAIVDMVEAILVRKP